MHYQLSLPLPTLLGSLWTIWEEHPILARMIPPQRVVTGRIPSSEEYPMPYVSILEAAGHRRTRSSQTQYGVAPVTFHLWVGEGQLALGETIENAISEAYANGQWNYAGGEVIDVLDGGPAAKIQPPNAEYRFWQIVKAFTLHVQQPRKD